MGGTALWLLDFPEEGGSPDFVLRMEKYLKHSQRETVQC